MQGYTLLNAEIDGGHSNLVEYYQKCKSGAILIGAELMVTLDSLINDLIHPASDVRFNIKKAHKRIRFIETKLKHFESPFAGKPFILTIEQKAIAEAIFGFEFLDPEYDEWVRLYREVLLVVARKNGKTPFIGALTLAEWICGEMGQKIMCASNDYEQAGLVFDCINNFREEATSIERITRKNNMGIFFGNRKQRRARGKFTKQNKGSIKKMSAKSGAKEGRNLKIVIVDEIHEMQDRLTVMPLKSSLTTQKEPLYFEITTEGIVNDGYLDERMVEARKVLKKEVTNRRWLIWLYTQDNESEVWANEKTWVKSNPLLGVSKKWSYLRDLVADARTNGSQRAFTLAKEFNLKSSRPMAWLPDEVIINNSPTFTLEDFRGCKCVCGADLSQTNDLSAVAFVFTRANSDTKYVHTMYFVPESKAVDPTTTESPTNTEKKNYIDWRDDGYCRIVKGNVIPDDTVAKYIREVYDTYEIRPLRVGYDDWNAKEFVKKVAFDFGDKVLVNINQSPKALDYATREIENDLRDNRMNYNNNPICIWCFKNTAMRYNSYGQCCPTKLGSYVGNKIDGTAAKAIAYSALRQVKTIFTSKVD